DSSGETFWPGQGQILSGVLGLQGRLGSLAPNLTGMRSPSRMEVELSVIHEAALAAPDVQISAAEASARPRARVFPISNPRKIPVAAKSIGPKGVLKRQNPGFFGPGR